MAPTEKVSTVALTVSLLWPTTNTSNMPLGEKLMFNAQKPASSLRVELEGLITAYELLPSDLYITHYMDNTQAIAIHDRLLNYGLPPPRKLMRMHYRRSIALLLASMQQRGTFLSMTHIHSHQEKNTPRDHPFTFPAGNLLQRTP
jgi:hypothetical protein